MWLLPLKAECVNQSGGRAGPRKPTEFRIADRLRDLAHQSDRDSRSFL